MSQVACELALFSAASAHARYDYYHLLSGVDLPLKTQDEIHQEIDQDCRTEYITQVSDPYNQADAECKTAVYHLFNEHLSPRSRSFFSWCLCRFNYALVWLQRLVGLRRRLGFEVRKASQWLSITDDLCRFLISNKALILNTFRYASCPDELFVPTFIAGTGFESRIFKPADKGNPSMRKIDWVRGSPYTWKSADFDELVSSGCWFARKFSSSDMDIVRRIEDYLLPPDKPLPNS